MTIFAADTIFAGKLIGMTTNEVYDFIDELKNELVRNEGIGDEDFTKKVVSNKQEMMLAMLTGVYDGRFWKVVDIAKKFGCEVSSVTTC